MPYYKILQICPINMITKNKHENQHICNDKPVLTFKRRFLLQNKCQIKEENQGKNFAKFNKLDKAMVESKTTYLHSGD
jgi:hypothetical protein